MASRLIRKLLGNRAGSYAETAFSPAPDAHAKRLLLASKLTGSDRQGRSMAEGQDIQESVRHKMEEERLKKLYPKTYR